MVLNYQETEDRLGYFCSNSINPFTVSIDLVLTIFYYLTSDIEFKNLNKKKCF